MFLTSNLSICNPEKATPVILNLTWKVGNTCRRSMPSRTKLPVSDGDLSFGILPIDQEQVCKMINKLKK